MSGPGEYSGSECTERRPCVCGGDIEQTLRRKGEIVLVGAPIDILRTSFMNLTAKKVLLAVVTLEK